MSEDKIRDMLAKAKMVDVSAFPGNRYDAIRLVGDLLRLKQKDWHSLTRVLCRAWKARLVFSPGNVFVELGKDADGLRLRIVVHSVSLKKTRNWKYTLLELAGVMSLISNDRYASLDSVGNMLIFKPSDYTCFLRILSKCSMCSAAFRIGNTQVRFSKSPNDEGVHMYLETKRGRKLLEHCFRSKELAQLTTYKRYMPPRTRRKRIIRIRGGLQSVEESKPSEMEFGDPLS
jgi:hypothetical protein